MPETGHELPPVSVRLPPASVSARARQGFRRETEFQRREVPQGNSRKTVDKKTPAAREPTLDCTPFLKLNMKTKSLRIVNSKDSLQELNTEMILPS